MMSFQNYLTFVLGRICWSSFFIVNYTVSNPQSKSFENIVGPRTERPQAKQAFQMNDFQWGPKVSPKFLS